MKLGTLIYRFTHKSRSSYIVFLLWNYRICTINLDRLPNTDWIPRIIYGTGTIVLVPSFNYIEQKSDEKWKGLGMQKSLSFYSSRILCHVSSLLVHVLIIHSVVFTCTLCMLFYVLAYPHPKMLKGRFILARTLEGSVLYVGRSSLLLSY